MSSAAWALGLQHDHHSPAPCPSSGKAEDASYQLPAWPLAAGLIPTVMGRAPSSPGAGPGQFALPLQPLVGICSPLSSQTSSSSPTPGMRGGHLCREKKAAEHRSSGPVLHLTFQTWSCPELGSEPQEASRSWLCCASWPPRLGQQAHTRRSGPARGLPGPNPSAVPTLLGDFLRAEHRCLPVGAACVILIVDSSCRDKINSIL